MDTSSRTPLFSRAEWKLLLVLASIQFANVLDFVLMIPLAPRFMLDFKISPEQFSHLVAAYGVSAFFAAIAGAFVLDRFGRRVSLNVLLVGFAAGTLGCALAWDFNSMLSARVLTGAFGGVLGSVVMATIGDRFADRRRGTATGIVMSSFAVASTAGIPLSLLLAEAFGPSSPFWILGTLAALLVGVIYTLPAMRDHMMSKADRVAPLTMFARILSNPRYLTAYLYMMCVIGSGFVVIPFLAAYAQYNVERPAGDVKFIYLAAGILTFFTTNLIGRWSDRYGKKLVFRIAASVAMVMALTVTNLPPISLGALIAVFAFFMVFTSGRFVPAQALITSVAAPHERGGFLSLNSAVAHLTMALASSVTGLLVTERADHHLIGYENAGFVSAALGITSLILVGVLKPWTAPVAADTTTATVAHTLGEPAVNAV